MDSDDLGCYPVLVGVAPGTEPDVTFEHQESLDTTKDMCSDIEDSMEAARSFYRPLAMNPVVPDPRQAVYQERCYHSTVTRQWRINAYETCNNCGKIPFLRWFYFCSEDTSGYTGPIDQTGSLLSEWITEAILAGEYTDAQRDKLIEQKLGVLEMCEKERNMYISDLRFSPGHGAEFQPGYHFQTHQGRVTAEAEPSFTQSQAYSRPVRCQFRACHHCECKLQERTWLSLNAICDDPDATPLNDWDFWKTPMSDASIVRNLGLRPPKPPPVPPHLSQYGYSVSQRRRMRRCYRQHIPGYESSLIVALMSNLSTIWEVNEGMESHITEVRIETSHELDTVLLDGLGTSHDTQRGGLVSHEGDEEDSDSDGLYS